jgi:hypothetical protein
MTFLQPLFLWGLPLALLPVLIHLLNRMRHKPKHWAAMAFLLRADRASTRQARLRELLILLCRTLGIAALALALARPVGGGGWFFTGAPDAVVVLLDRSATMEMRAVPGEPTRRELALAAIERAGRVYEGRTAFVLLDSATNELVELGSVTGLSRLSVAGPSDGAADMPAMFDRAVEWIERTKPGSVELWVVSDLQESNWDPANTAWGAMGAALEAMPQDVRVRVFETRGGAALNRTVSLAELQRKKSGGAEAVRLGIDVQTSGEEGGEVPIEVQNGPEHAVWEVTLDGPVTRLSRVLPLRGDGGVITLPADGNDRDNRVYFTAPPPVELRAGIYALDDEARRTLVLAAAPGARVGTVAERIDDPAGASWDRYAVVAWQAPLPDGEVAASLMKFAEAGGVIVFFPPGEKADGVFAGRQWREIEDAPATGAFGIAQWSKQEGPFANTESGAELPMAAVSVARRQLCSGEKNGWAYFGDGEAFAVRNALGQGEAVWVATLPKGEWSNLASGAVLVPAMQRWIERGAARFAGKVRVSVGDPGAKNLASVEPGKEARVHAGLYRDGERIVAVNRPAREDDPGMITPERVRGLLPAIDIAFWEGRDGGGVAQREIWRMFVGAMLVALFVEALLTLPRRLARPGELEPAAVPA